MRIAIVHPEKDCDRITPTAPSILIHDMMRAQAGVDEIKLFCGWTKNPYLDLNLDMLPEGTPSTRKAEAPLFAERIAAFKPDLIEVHLEVGCALNLARRFPEIPTLYYNHSPFEHPYWHVQFTRALRYCHLAKMICVSNFARQCLLSYHPEHDQLFLTMQNALSPQGWLADDSKKEKVILFCGRTIPDKGIEEFVSAMADLVPNFADWRVVILSLVHAPDGSKYYDKVTHYWTEQKAELEAALGEQCIWINNAPRETIQEWTRKAMISVVPSNYDESFALVLLEAHMAKCAVVSSYRGGMGEVSGTEGAWHLAEVSSGEIIRAVRGLMENPEACEVLAQRGHDYVMKTHNITDRIIALTDLRRQLIESAKQNHRTRSTWKKHVRRDQLRVFATKLKQVVKV